jgi:thiosulfate reductase / polysulfide reductase chain A
VVNGVNLPLTLPNQKNTLEAIDNLEFMVVIDTMPMEVTGFADVVLPECTYLERYDACRTDPHREPTIALRMPAAEPKYNTKPAWWMAKQLAERLGTGRVLRLEGHRGTARLAAPAGGQLRWRK